MLNIKTSQVIAIQKRQYIDYNKAKKKKQTKKYMTNAN